jgi:hypothetical protein
VRPQRSFVATQQSRASCCLASAPTASVVVGPLASMEPTVAAPAAPPLSFATPPSTPLRPRVVERACAEPHRVSPRRRSRWETGGRAAGHPSRRRAPRRPPYGRHTKPSCGGGGGWPQPSRWRLPRTGGGEGVGSAVGWCRRRSLTLAPELRPRRGGVALGASTRRCR